MRHRNFFPAAAFAAAIGLVTAAGGASGAVHLNGGALTMTVAPGDSFYVPLTVFQADAQFNAFDADVNFDPARLTFISTSPSTNQIGPLMTPPTGCSKFHIFAAHSNYLEIHYSLLCNQYFVTGPGVIYKVRFKAGPDTGSTTISFTPGTAFFNAGFLVTPLDAQNLTVIVTNHPVGVDDGGALPSALEMAVPAPNPRIGSVAARISFALPAPTTVKLDLFDTVGRRVAGRAPEYLPAGRHSLLWNAPVLPSGTYFARLTTGDGSSVRRSWVLLR